MKKFKPSPIGQSTRHIQGILEKLADYLSHNNEKFREECEDVFASLPAHAITPLPMCYEVLCGGSRDRPPKATTSRLAMLVRIMDKFPLTESADTVIDFATRYLEDKNSDVRTQAAEVMAKVSQEVGY